MITIASNIQVGAGAPLLLIAGPCQLESKELSFFVCEKVKALCLKYGFSFVFKSSFDKANRTSINGERGMGIEAGLNLLNEIRSTFDVPILTDVHTEEEAKLAGEVVDVIQIPAFLCRQTDLLLAAGKTGKTVQIKKGQFLHPNDMKHAAQKVTSTGNKNILLCERGTCFGYRDLVVDFRGLLMMKESGFPVIYDATHSVQQMGGENGSSGGFKEYIVPLAKAAVSVGVDGIFIECHPNPQVAPSDSKSMLELDKMEEILKSLKAIHEVSNAS